MKTEPEMCYNQGKITESFVLAATGHGNYETHTHSDIMYSNRSSDRAGVDAPAAQDTAAYAPDESERLVLYTSHKKEVWWPIVKEFESRTGIWVEVVQGGTNELLEQLQKEQDAPRADVMFGGGVESLEACRALFEPYVCRGAEQILPQYRAQDSSWTPFSSLPVVLVYNPKLLSSGQLVGIVPRTVSQTDAVQFIESDFFCFFPVFLLDDHQRFHDVFQRSPVLQEII